MNQLQGQYVPIVDSDARLRTSDALVQVIRRLATKCHTHWLKCTYPFAAFGSHVTIDPSVEIRRSSSRCISVGNRVYIGPDAWLLGARSGARLIVGEGCVIGRRATISCANEVILETHISLGPSVLIMDHNHDYSNPNLPIHAQGITQGGRVCIEKNCWLGHGAVILSNHGDLVLGRNSVVGANAVVTRSFPPYSVIAGNPAKRIKTFDADAGKWVKVSEAESHGPRP